MNIKDSMSLFGISSIEGLNEDIVRKQYKQLMKKYHPDNYGSNDMAAKVNNALNILNDLCTKIKNANICSAKQQKKIVMLTLDELNEYYNGHLNIDKKAGAVGSNSILDYYIQLVIEINYIYDNNVYNVTEISTYKSDRKYNIDINLNVNDICDSHYIRIFAYNKCIDAELVSVSSKRLVTLDNNIKIGISINKKLQRK